MGATQPGDGASPRLLARSPPLQPGEDGAALLGRPPGLLCPLPSGGCGARCGALVPSPVPLRGGWGHALGGLLRAGAAGGACQPQPPHGVPVSTALRSSFRLGSFLRTPSSAAVFLRLGALRHFFPKLNFPWKLETKPNRKKKAKKKSSYCSRTCQAKAAPPPPRAPLQTLFILRCYACFAS